MSEQKKIIFIDENKNSRRVFKRELQEMFGEAFIVESIPPGRNIPEMLDKVLALEPRVVMLILDQQLFNDGTADFSGTQFTLEFRRTEDKLPIYILTSHVADMRGSYGEVEGVIEKETVRNDGEKRRELAQRMGRHISQFSQICDQRNERISELIRKTVSESLNDEELKELNALTTWKVGPLLEAEAGPAYYEKSVLDQEEILLDEIKGKLKELRGD